MTQGLLDWFKAERACTTRPAMTPRPGGILFGGMVWGGKYLDRLERYCVPSLLDPGNIAPLAGRSRLVLYTVPSDVDRLKAILSPFHACGIDVQLRALPGGHDKVRTQSLLATVQRVLLAEAGAEGMGFHPFLADHVYNKDFMTNLSRLGKDHSAIAQMTISGQIETAAAELDHYRDDGILAIPARDLGTIAHDHMHQQTKPFVINDLSPGLMTPTPYFVWRLADRLVIHCPHMNPEWMSPEVCRAVPEPNRNTIVGAMDCSLPYLFPEKWYTPTLEDGMTCIEFSDATKPERTAGPIEDMTDLAWHIMRFNDDYLPFLARRSVLPLHPHDRNVVDERDAARQFARIVTYMRMNRQRMAEESIQQRAKELGWLKPGEESPHSRFKAAQKRAALA